MRTDYTILRSILPRFQKKQITLFWIGLNQKPNEPLMTATWEKTGGQDMAESDRAVSDMFSSELQKIDSINNYDS